LREHIKEMVKKVLERDVYWDGNGARLQKFYIL